MKKTIKTLIFNAVLKNYIKHDLDDFFRIV